MNIKETDLQEDTDLKGESELSEESDSAEPSFKKGLLFGLIMGFLICALGVSVFLLIKTLTSSSQSYSKAIDEAALKKAEKIEKVINANLCEYNENVSADNLKEGMYRGMLDSLGDPYSEYYSVEELSEVINETEGISYGIGCYVMMDESGLAVITGTVEGSPAESAGVTEGDIIVAVEGESVAGLSLEQVVSLIKGPENTYVEITFSRDGEPVVISVMRGNVIENNTVMYGPLVDNNEIGYIRITQFEDVTVQQYIDAVADLKKDGIKGLIIDVRSNPGGSFPAVVDIARQIVPEGTIVYTMDKNGGRKDYTSDGANELDIPLVVLVNQYSASASEILAGAVQDCNKGTLVGTTTFGKGIVQTVISLGDGSAVKLTTQEYYTPSGRNIQGTGIAPDIEIEYDKDAEKDNQVMKALEILETKIGEQ